MNTVIEIILTLAFVFLTYSILTMIVVEIVAGILNLRGRNLRLAVRRMLQDSDHRSDKELSRFKKILRLIMPEKFERKFVKQFFDQPTIKYLGKNGYYKTPSYIAPADFAKNLYDILASAPGHNDLNKIENAIDYDADFDQKMSFSSEEWETFNKEFEDSEDKADFLEEWMAQYKNENSLDRIEFSELEFSKLERELTYSSNTKDKLAQIVSWKEGNEDKPEIEPETLYQLRGIFKDAGGDAAKFKLLIENWFNRTMDRSIGWYKKKISLITFFVGLAIAVSFNVDTIYMTMELKNNTALRKEMITKIESIHSQDTTLIKYVDSLKSSQHAINESFSMQGYKNFKPEITIDPKDGTENRKSIWHFAILGWILTGIAISFGAPFWFDILNKFMRIRSAGTQEKPAADQTKKESKEGAHIVSGQDRKG